MAEPTRDELDAQAEQLGIDPSDYSTKDELAAAISDVEAAQGEPEADSVDSVALDPDDVPKGTVLVPLCHDGKITAVGEKAPKSLSDDQLEVLREQGAIA